MPTNPFKRLGAIWRSFDPQARLRGHHAAAQILNVPLNIDKTLNVARTVQNRTGYEAFKEVKIPGNDKTLDVLCKEFKENHPNVNAPVIAWLQDLRSTAPNQYIDQAFRNFQAAMQTLSAQINKVSPDYSPLGVHDRLSKKKDLVLKALGKRQEDEIIALKEKFGIDAQNNPLQDMNNQNLYQAFRQSLSQQPPAGLGIVLGHNNSNLPAIYKQFESALIKKHQEEKAGIEKALNEDITSMDKCYEKKVLKNEYFEEMYENEGYYGANKLKEEIDKKQPDMEEGVHEEEQVISFDDVTIEEMGRLSALVTVTGLPITLEVRKEKNKNGEDQDVNVLKVELRSGLKSRFYDEKYDVRSLMNAARAAGIDPLHVSITHGEDPFDKEGNLTDGDALKLAKLAYCEAIRAGYKPEDIKLKINGKPADTKDEKKYLTSDQLFANDPNMLQTAKEAAKRKQAILDEHKNPQEIKDESEKIRQGTDITEVQENTIKQGLG